MRNGHENYCQDQDSRGGYRLLQTFSQKEQRVGVIKRFRLRTGDRAEKLDWRYRPNSARGRDQNPRIQRDREQENPKEQTAVHLIGRSANKRIPDIPWRGERETSSPPAGEPHRGKGRGYIEGVAWFAVRHVVAFDGLL